MPVSSYQAQQVLAELRKRLGLDKPAAPPDDKAARVSTITIVEDAADEQGAHTIPGVTARTVVDDTRYAPATEQELERRAGSFMQPSVSPRQPVKPIPKTASRPAPPVPPRSLGEGD